MVTSERLLRFIMQLQNEKSPAKRRQLLLDEVRQCSGARLAALFLYVPDTHVFVVRGYSGTYSPEAPARIPGGNGLSLALTQQGWLLLSAQESRRRLNSQELTWVERGASIRLHSVRSSKRSEAEQGVVLLVPADTGPQSQEGMEELGVYVSLLSAYLSRAQEEESVMDELSLMEAGEGGRQETVALQEVEQRAGVDASMIGDQETLTNPRTVPAENALTRSIAARLHQGNTPTLATGLSKLYEIMLIGEYKVEGNALYALLAEQMSGLLGAEQAWLFLYQAQGFSLVGQQGADDADELLRRLPEPEMLEELAEREPGETMTALDVDDGIILILPLSYEPGLAGVALFRLAHSMPPLETRLVLAYMARFAVLLLRTREAHVAIQRESRLEERNRLARDIHDGPAQQLTLALLKLEYVQRRVLKSPEHAESAFWQALSMDLGGVYTILRDCVEDLRHTITSELPMQLARQSFVIALRSLIEEFREHHPELEVMLNDHHASVEHISQEIEIIVFRFVQEALNNVVKHARASQAIIDLLIQSDFLQVQVHDDGVGFEPGESAEVVQVAPELMGRSEKGAHLGLKAMRERVASVGGLLEIQSAPGKGTTVLARLPLSTLLLELTEREREVVRLMSEGLTNRAIASRLMISIETVKTHIHHIMQKLQARDRTQAVALAMKYGLI